MTEETPLRPLWPLSLLGCFLLASCMVGWCAWSWMEIERYRAERAEVEGVTARAESGDARVRDSLDTVKAGYLFRMDSMKMAWAERLRKPGRGRR